MRWRLSLTSWMLLAVVAGAALGILAPDFALQLEFLSSIFLRLIQSIIAPVLFGVLVRAIGRAGGMGELGRIGWKSVVCFEVSTTIALLLGWFTVAIVQPGKGVALATSGKLTEVGEFSARSILEGAFPTSIVDAMARGDMLQIVVFCFLFGLACLSLGEKARPMVDFADTVAQVAFRYTDYVMYLAPAAVFDAMAANTAAGARYIT